MWSARFRVGGTRAGPGCWVSKRASWAKPEWFLLCWALARRKDHLWGWSIPWGSDSRRLQPSASLVPGTFPRQRLWTGLKWAGARGCRWPLQTSQRTSQPQPEPCPGPAASPSSSPTTPCAWAPGLFTQSPSPRSPQGLPRLLLLFLPASASLTTHLQESLPAPSFSSTPSAAPFRGLSQYGIINSSVRCLLPS